MKGKVNICIFGDSIVYGQGDTEKGGWAIQLRNHFESRANKELDARVYALGIRGETSQDLLKRLKAECIARKPDIIFCAIGINDSQVSDSKKGTPLTPLSEFIKNIKGIFDIAEQFTNKIVFIGLTSVDESKTTPTDWGTYYDNENVKRYDTVIEEFCRKKEVTYIQINNLLSEADLFDGIHPNIEGHKKMFEKIRNNLENVLS
ncbi:MAG: GDSL-type esterase/lipase family protein [bacterium]|nr:GDSL-type esterase/lipase family protein [bacterium]